MRTDRDRVVLHLAELDLTRGSQGRDAQREPEAGEGGALNRGALDRERAHDRAVAESHALSKPLDQPLVFLEHAVSIEVDPGVDSGDVETGGAGAGQGEAGGKPRCERVHRHAVLVVTPRDVVGVGASRGHDVGLDVDRRSHPDVAVLYVPRAVGRERRAVGVGRVAEVEVLSRGHPAAEQDQERQNAEPTPGSGC